MSTRTTRTYIATAAFLLLTACGGGGSSSDTNAPPVTNETTTIGTPVTPASTTSAAQQSVPAGTYANAEVLAAFNHLNDVRASAGLGKVAQSAALDQSAQAHISYLIAQGGTLSHNEAAGQPGFTGVDAGARIVSAQYPLNTYMWSETLNSDATWLIAVDTWMAATYHRAALMSASVDVGIGAAALGPQHLVNFNLAVPAGKLPQAGAAQVATWPASNATGVALLHAAENPNPVQAELGAYCAPNCPGYPVSVHVDGISVDVAVTSFTLVDGSGSPVPSKLIQERTTNTMFALVPLAPLKPLMTYTAMFVGKSGANNRTATWSFTTGAK